MTPISEPALICVDWGSTNFRAFLLNGAGALVDQIQTDQGMLKLLQAQFEPTLLTLIAPWLDKGLPILMAGMVGSKQGWFDAGYVSCPVDQKGLSEQLFFVPNAANLKIAIVPGIKGLSHADQPDVMRGEEVQFFGALALLAGQALESETTLYCLPGTHAKWLRTNQQGNAVVSFSTQMTGELYSLLEKHSLLGRMTQAGDPYPNQNLTAFEAGVARSQINGDLLHSLFSARTRVLMEHMQASDVRSYLSGLLIGAEVKSMLKALPQVEKVLLIGNEKLSELYRHTLGLFGVAGVPVDGDKAAYQGLLLIAKQAELIS